PQAESPQSATLEAAVATHTLDSVATEPLAGALVESPVTPVGEVEAPVIAAASETEPQSSHSLYEQRLLAMAPDNFTLQLLGSHSEASVQEFIKQRGDGDKFAYFESRYQERPWFVTVFGSYSSRAQAEAAKAALPAELKALNPWVRNLAAIQSDIRKFNP
ncbi:MAG: hypothetical protein RLZZ385_1707, partial [Pseudomonadota bacterium]